MRESVKLSREIFSQPAFDEFRDIELAPGPEADTDAKLDEFVKANSDSAYHPSCTCKMGDAGDAETVVDEQCRVVGKDGFLWDKGFSQYPWWP
jgi:choline dehydrogenase